MTRFLLSRIRAVWHHYSTWALACLLAVGGLQEYVPQVESYLPRWLVVVIAVAGLVGKLINQAPKPGEIAQTSYQKYRDGLPR